MTVEYFVRVKMCNGDNLCSRFSKPMKIGMLQEDGKKFVAFRHLSLSQYIIGFITLKGKWQQNFLSSYLKETPKQDIEVYYTIFISALFGEIF